MKAFRRLCLPAVLGFCLFLMASNAWAADFSDVPPSSPDYEAINALRDQGVIEGYPDNTFRPNNSINRAEILKIVLLGSKTLVPEIQKQSIFPDVDSSAWYGKFVSKAKNLGIVKGDENTGLFRPGDNVNLSEALKILLTTQGITAPIPKANPYSDVPKDIWFAPYFEYARLAGLLDQKTDEKVLPAKPITRALLAELMYRLSKSTYILPDGKASYYGADFHGKTTSSGEVFDASAFTAAHRTYPFGTWLKVTNVANGKSVDVRVNDRGPYVSDPTRIIDLSEAAFETIAPLSAGVIEVKIEPTSAPDTTQATTDTSEAATTPTPPAATSDTESTLTGDLLNATRANCPEAQTLAYIAKDTFDGIILDQEIPNRILLDETLTLQGTTSASSTTTVSAFIVDSQNNQTSFGGTVTDGRFSLPLRFPKEGTYKLGILPGDSGNSLVKPITVLKNTCIAETQNDQLPLVNGTSIKIDNGDMVIRWNPGDYNLFKITLQQGGLKKSFLLHNASEWKPYYRDFASFQSGSTQFFIRGALLTQKSILEPSQIEWSPAGQTDFIATNHYEYILNKDEVELVSLTQDAILQDPIKVVFKAKVPIRSKAAVILPNGKVQEIPVTSTTQTAKTNAFGQEVFPVSDDPLTAGLVAQETALYFLEVNNDEGLAVINVPIYVRNQFPLIPTARDLSDGLPVDLGNDLGKLRNQLLALVDKDRSNAKLSALTLDDNLNLLAQFRSDDMATNNYFSHWDSQGRNANDLRKNYGIQTLVAENLAKDVNLELAEYGLMRSAIHRSNLLSSDWTRIGLGISKTKDGGYVVVQIFSTNPLDMSDVDSLRSTLLAALNKNRTSTLALQNSLTTLAQAWSEKMASEDFFAFTDKSGKSLVDTIHDAGIKSALGTYIMGNSSFSDAVQQASGNTELQSGNWKSIGVGIKQDNLGIIKITLIYTE
jgi:rare lipoprotein A